MHTHTCDEGEGKQAGRQFMTSKYLYKAETTNHQLTDESMDYGAARVVPLRVYRLGSDKRGSSWVLG